MTGIEDYPPTGMGALPVKVMIGSEDTSRS